LQAFPRGEERQGKAKLEAGRSIGARLELGTCGTDQRVEGRVMRRAIGDVDHVRVVLKVLRCVSCGSGTEAQSRRFP